MKNRVQRCIVLSCLISLMICVAWSVFYFNPDFQKAVNEKHYSRLAAAAQWVNHVNEQLHPENIGHCLGRMRIFLKHRLAVRLERIDDDSIPVWAAAIKHLFICQLNSKVPDFNPERS